MDIPRPEYPRPQFKRDTWLCLNGPWQFEIDAADTGLERGLLERELEARITVPFCPESERSGVGHTDFMEAVWYRRQFTVPEAWRGQRILLHFQAVDYEATVWIDGSEAGRHRGGFTPFCCDITGAVEPGRPATLVVRARDPRGEPKPAGKQSPEYANRGCVYTRTTGIWQTVWMEPVPEVHLRRPRIIPDVTASTFHIEQPLSRNSDRLRLQVELADGEGVVCRHEIPCNRDLTPRVTLAIPEDRVRLWEPGKPYLYDIAIRLISQDGTVVDSAASYAGLRSVSVDTHAVRINNRPVFQRLVLDQGYYPDGIMTAPSDADLEHDITLAMQAGFNGARLHEKVFEERFLYHADRLGYLVWAEFGDWGYRPGIRPVVPDPHYHQPAAAVIAQWLEVLHRDVSHPSIVGWCGLNETRQPIEDRMTALDDMTRATFLAAKAMDTSRPVLDASGYAHRIAESDVWDCHDYEQDPAELDRHHRRLAEGIPFVNNPAWSIAYGGQPFFVSEFGGTCWNPEADETDPSWGYGDRPRSVEDFYRRFEGLCTVLLRNTHLFGYCYTQLTDVFQEQNGMFHFDRRAKFDVPRLRRIQTERAAIENT